jgi:hypothetical protein
LLETAQSVQIALGGIVRAAGVGKLGIEGEQFFASAPGVYVGLIGLRRLYLGLGAGRLTAKVSVIEL